MANLFGKNKLRDVAQKVDTSDLEFAIKIIESWQNDYHNGTLKQDKETSREQAYNQDFFIKVLGYKEKPASPFSIEPKATTAKGQLPDAVLSYTDKTEGIENVAAVVELKGAAIDLDRPQRREGNLSPVQQAFKYKTQYRSCPFVIVSNFWEFRLYQDNLLDYESWTLDDLADPAEDYLKLKEFYCLIHSDNLTAKKGKSKTEELLSDIRFEQNEIGKKFYKLYKEIRLELLRDIYRNNEKVRTNIDLAIEKAQKIIDRVVFAAFAEDRGLLPDNTLIRVAKSADNSVFGGSLWNTLKAFFEAIDRGSEKLEIPNGYNGGLFKRDEQLNSLEISDVPLRKVIELGKYNFVEDLSVNILGHIFEQSISDLEEIKNRVNESQNLETLSHSRRKKDGIFYTPDYIVRYIVDNSLGAYLREHEDKFKDEFGLKGDITDKTYEKREKQAYRKYQDFLHNVKVVDPACGSGAFLVYVFDYLLAENKRVEDILGNTLFSGDEYIRDILQNNIYGVDLNEESVEITKLSLWLKSAQKGKKLTSLDKNIKCGNSVIDNTEVAGVKAFNWQKEFANIFANGGFDVVVGNPPYVDSETMTKSAPEERVYLTKHYETASGNWDLFVLFVQKGADILKSGGYSSMIMPNKVLSSAYAKTLRYYISEKYKLVGITDVTKEGVFEVDVYPVIITVKNDRSASQLVSTEGVRETISQNITNTDLPENWALLLNKSEQVIHKVKTVNLSSLLDVAAAATVAEAYDLKELIHENKHATEGKIINTGTIDPYVTAWGIQPINYIKNRYTYPCVDTKLLKKKGWHNIDKIIVAGMAIRLEACFSTGAEYFPAKSTTVIYAKDGISKGLKAALGFLNSKYASYLFLQENSQLSMAGGYMNINKNNISKLEVPVNLLNNSELASSADKHITLSTKLQKTSHNFSQLISDELKLGSWPKKLKTWWNLEFTDFTKSLKLRLTLQQKDELLHLFDKYQSKCLELDHQISKIDQEIDRLVYELYKLTPEEVKLIEG